VLWLAALAIAPATTSCAGLSAGAVAGGGELVLELPTPASGALAGRLACKVHIDGPKYSYCS
jgi:hypothetical protein